ncbi:MAG: flagellar hook-basal body complex protein FliE [Steroidobacteraceae bacterium]
MSNLQISQVLAQIRALSQQVTPPMAGPGAAGAAGGAGAVGGAGGPSGVSGPSAFATLLKTGIDQVNQAQQKASDLATQFQRGTPGVDLPKVMIEMQKATVSFRALTEVRNRLVSAYQEIMNMQM